MIEWLFAAIKVYAIGFGVLFVLVAGLAGCIIINVLISLRKADREMDRWRNRHFR